MAIDEAIETLSFGQTAPKVSSCLGLYLSPETIYISETHFDKAGRLVVDHLLRIPVPPPEAAKGKTTGPGATTLNTDFLGDSARLGALIRESMAGIKWKSRYVMVTLSHHLGLLRYFMMPAIERPFWKTAIPLEAKKYIPIPFDALTYDFQVLPLPPDAGNKPRQGALIAVTQRKNLANINLLLQSLGLSLCGMEVAPCSVLRLWQVLEKGDGSPYAQVHFEGGSVRILVADKGIPMFFREVFLGAGVSLADQRKVDLGNCLSFAQAQLGVGKLLEVRASGGEPLLGQWVEAFTKEVGIPARIQDTPAMLGIKKGDWGGYAAIGASLRFAGAKTMTLDIGAVGRVTEEEKRVAKDIMAVSLALAGLLVLVGLFRGALYHAKARELGAYKRDVAVEAVFSNRSANEIESMIKSMREQSAAAGVLGGETSKVSGVLRDVVENLPEKAWLTSFDLNNPLQRTDRIGAELILTGHAVAPTKQEEQDLYFQFRNSLSKAKVTGALFSDINGSVEHAKNDSESGSLSPEDFEEKREKRTEWRITGGVKR
jgi:hypothetical protein